MPDDKEMGKLLKFKGRNDFPGTVEILEGVMEEVRDFPVKKVFVILLDEKNEACFWGNHLTKEQYAKCLLDFQMHCMEAFCNEEYFIE